MYSKISDGVNWNKNFRRYSYFKLQSEIKNNEYYYKIIDVYLW